MIPWYFTTFWYLSYNPYNFSLSQLSSAVHVAYRNQSRTSPKHLVEQNPSSCNKIVTWRCRPTTTNWPHAASDKKQEKRRIGCVLGLEFKISLWCNVRVLVAAAGEGAHRMVWLRPKTCNSVTNITSVSVNLCLISCLHLCLLLLLYNFFCLFSVMLLTTMCLCFILNALLPSLYII